jgi:UDP-N-acetyl-D-mannosaminuronate dehydrogenase
MGRNHLRAYGELDGVEVVAVADPSRKVLERAVKGRTAKPYDDYRRLLSEEAPDLVSIAVPTGLHHEVTLTALEAGAEDVRSAGEASFEVITAPSALQTVRRALETAGLEIESADVTQLPSSTVPVEESEARRLLRLIDALEDLDDVQGVFSNYDIDDTIMEKLLAEA